MIGNNRIIINNTVQDILITELGQTVVSGESIDLYPYHSYETIAQCNSLVYPLANGLVTLNDGLQDYNATDAIKLLLGVENPRVVDDSGYQYIHIAGNPLDYDRKIVVHASPRPLSPKTYTHYLGAADDLENSLHGNGQSFRITVTGTYESFDFKFLSDSQLYMRGAFFGWENAAWGTEVSCEMYASATQVYAAPSNNFLSVDQYNRIHLDLVSGTYSWASNPVPTPALDANFVPNGFWDSDGESLTYNATGSGSYDLYNVDRQIARFVQKMQIYRDNYVTTSLESDDVEYVPPGYYFKMVVYNPEEHDELVDGQYVTVTGCQPMRLWGTFFCYRQDTLP